MKKMLSIVVSVVMVLCLLPAVEFAAFAATSGTTGDCTWSLNGSVLTISGNGSMGDYSRDSLPSWDSCRKVIIEEGVTSIGDFAFYYCTNLTSISIGKDVMSMGRNAFDSCTKLTSVSLPDGFTYIGLWAFQNCRSLENIAIPNSVTFIGGTSFKNCTSLTSITIPDGVTSIGTSAFSGCTGLTSITIPDSVTSIGNSVFRGCNNLESITIPFVGNSRKTSSDTYQYPFGCIFGEDEYDDSIRTEQNYYGSNTYSTTSTTYYIPRSLKSVTVTGGEILYGAFYGCSSLTSVTIDNGVTGIGERAFYNCNNLTNVTIGNGVTTIGSSVFENCTSLTDIVIPDRVTSIGSVAFSGCSNLTNVTIGNSVTSIGSNAFFNCSNLTCVTIGNGVTTIGSRVFENCTSLTDIVIPDRVTSIGSTAFSGCSNLTNVTIGNSVTSIGNGAFRKCTGLDSIIIPDNVTSIGNGAFSGCSGLESITIPFVGGSHVTTSDAYRYPFGYIFGTESYTGGVKTAQFYVAPGAPSTTSANYYIPSSLKSVTVTGGDIRSGAFLNCSNLTSVNVPNGATIIDVRAFDSCTSLTSITIPASVTSIGRNAFIYCSSLTDVWYGGDENDRNAISIDSNNSSLTDATWYYNYSPCDNHIKVLGATIKTDTDMAKQGLRYAVTVGDAAAMANVQEFGVLLIPQGILGGKELTLETAAVLKIAVKNGDENWDTVLADGGFQASLLNSVINGRQNYAIASRAYTVLNSGKVLYGEASVKSVTSVALAIANTAKNNGAVTTDEIAALLTKTSLSDSEITKVLTFCRENIQYL